MRKIYLGRPKKNRVGEKYFTKEGYEVEIIEYFDAHNCTINFININVILFNIRFDHIKDGSVINPYHPTVCGVGYLGIGKYTSRNKVSKDKSKHYTTWANMIKRCYDEKIREKYPTYKDVTVCEEWKCFQNFAEWFEENYREGFALDKDILLKGNKVYSPETCCFIPNEINALFTKRQNHRGKYPIGVLFNNSRFRAQCCSLNNKKHIGSYNTSIEAFEVYKIAKEEEIKRVAKDWKDKITEKVYQALINYKVEIDD